MIETFTFISESYSKLAVRIIDYKGLSVNGHNIIQSDVYRTLNSLNPALPYTISDNQIIFCSDGGHEDFAAKVRQAFTSMGFTEYELSNLSVREEELNFNEQTKKIFYKFVREYILESHDDGYRDRYGISYELHSDPPLSGLRRYLVMNVSGQPVGGSMILIFDIRHKNDGLGVRQFREMTKIEPLKRYKVISDALSSIFGDKDTIKVKIKGNPDFIFTRIKISANGST